MNTYKRNRLIALFTLVIGIFLYPADPEPKPPGEHKGLYILEADFHTHSFLAGAFPMPWDIVEMARKQNLHVIGMVEHNSIIGAEMAELYAKTFRDDVTLIVGEEVTTPRHHILLLGLEKTISAGLSPEEVIKQSKEQGAVSILAHPARKFWPSYDKVRFDVDAVEAATGSARREFLKKLNPGEETALAKSVKEARKERGWSPYDMKLYYDRVNAERAAKNAGKDPAQAALETEAKYAGKVVGINQPAIPVTKSNEPDKNKYHKPLAATANSDYHGLLYLGYVRTIVFAEDKSAQGVIDAVRKGQTLAYYGDSEKMIGPDKWKDFLKESGYQIAGGIYDYNEVPSANILLTMILFAAFGYLYLLPRARKN